MIASPKLDTVLPHIAAMAAALLVDLAVRHPLRLPPGPFDTRDVIVVVAASIYCATPLVFILAFVPSDRGFTFVKIHAAIMISAGLVAQSSANLAGGAGFVLLTVMAAHVPAGLSWIMTDRDHSGPPWLFTRLTLAFTVGGGIGSALP